MLLFSGHGECETGLLIALGLACERRRISGCHWDKRQPEIRLRSHTTGLFRSQSIALCFDRHYPRWLKIFTRQAEISNSYSDVDPKVKQVCLEAISRDHLMWLLSYCIYGKSVIFQPGVSNRWRRFVWLSIGIDYQYQSIDKLVSIGIDWLQIDGNEMDASKMQ